MKAQREFPPAEARRLRTSCRSPVIRIFASATARQTFRSGFFERSAPTTKTAGLPAHGLVFPEGSQT
jgi:hypothetical protein